MVLAIFLPNQYVPVVVYKITILIDAGLSIIGQMMQQTRLDNKKKGKMRLIVLFFAY